MVGWLGTMLLAAPVVAENCADWNSERFFASAAVEEVVGCLHAGADANARDDRGFTPLHLAAQNSSAAVIRALTALTDADPNEPNDTGGTALHLAARLNPSAAVIEALIDVGADPNLRDEGGRAPLHLAAWKNPSAAVVEALIDAGADPNEPNGRGWTPLSLAAKANSEAVVTALIDAGADPNEPNDRGWTPIQLAANANSEAVVAALIDAGADPNEPNDRGWTPIQFAAKANSEAVVAALIDAGADPGMRDGANYYVPVSEGYLGGNRLAAVAHRLRASAAEGNAKAQYGLGVIYAEAFGEPRYGVQAAAWYRKAAGHGHAKARTRLDELISRRGYTSLHLATIRHSSVVAVLRDGADPDARDNAGNTALHLAASNTDDPAVFEALVGAGADADARDDFGDTPLHLAARYNTNPAVLAVLIKAGADPDAQGESDATPLHWAAWNNGVPAVLALVNAGANLNARRRDGATPLHWAMWNDDVSVIPALLDAGANPDVSDSSGDTPLYWAVRYANLSAFSAFPGTPRLLMSSDFDVYYRERAVFYIKENCTNDDTRPKFFLHLIPVDKDALSDDRKQYGFDNFDFSFDKHGTLSDGQCGAVRKVPDYGIATIRTGQFIPGKGHSIWEGHRIWEATYHISKD